MPRRLTASLLVLALAAPSTSAQQDAARPGTPEARAWLSSQLDALEALYRDLHREPELSFHEVQTSERLAKELAGLGIEVTRSVGGHGVVAVLKSGAGPVGMLRADMDALPIAEQTGLPYAAPTSKTADGVPVGKMHACGHDVHMACLVGAARWFAAHREAWNGTLVLIGQPAEERGGGAKAMLADGLFERFPKPEWALALHTAPDLPTGVIGLRAGYTLANVDSCDVTMHGRGGHGSAPHLTIDPILQAAQLVLDLQTLVTREIDPVEPAVLTVGSIHGGTKHNVIDDRCHLQITLRSYTPKVREQLKAGVVRKANAVAAGARAPEPTIEFSEPCSALFNDTALTATVARALRETLGEASVRDYPQAMGAEDFSAYGAAGVPLCMFRLGTVAQERLAAYEAAGTLPSLHSARYWPDARESIRTGVAALVAATRALLVRGQQDARR